MNDRASDETKPTQAIRRVVESITSPSNTPQDKIARIYNYVQTEIRNADFATNESLTTRLLLPPLRGTVRLMRRSAAAMAHRARSIGCS